MEGFINLDAPSDGVPKFGRDGCSDNVTDVGVTGATDGNVVVSGTDGRSEFGIDVELCAGLCAKQTALSGCGIQGGFQASGALHSQAEARWVAAVALSPMMVSSALLFANRVSFPLLDSPAARSQSSFATGARTKSSSLPLSQVTTVQTTGRKKKTDAPNAQPGHNTRCTSSGIKMLSKKLQEDSRLI
uniref:Uncharacterized protein n=1 Tax=Ditylenchus dipsaci TaxID=166011 RepID=A0A915E113_9BILA